MQNLSSPLAPDIWIADMFMTKAVQKGGVIRRSRRDIERFAGMDRFLRELERRGFQAFVNGGQVVVFCNREPLRRLA
ncbi:MAG: N-(5'-phosphoribosyl)anthranilate isomerase [Pseudomonadota bacterium]